MDKQTKIWLICAVLAVAILSAAVAKLPEGNGRLAALGVAVLVFPVVPIVSSIRSKKGGA